MFPKTIRVSATKSSFRSIPTRTKTLQKPNFVQQQKRPYSLGGYGSNSETMPMTNKQFDEKKPKEKLPMDKLGTDGVYMEGKPNREVKKPLDPEPKTASSQKDEKLSPEEMRTHYRGTGAGPDAQDGGLKPSSAGKSPSKSFQNAVDESYNANHNQVVS